MVFNGVKWQESWAKEAMNGASIKRAFNGFAPDLTNVLITRVLIEDISLVINVQLHPLPTNINESWVKEKYDRIDIRLIFHEWVDQSTVGKLKDFLGIRTLVLGEQTLSICQLCDGFSHEVFRSKFNFLEVKVLPNIADAEYSRLSDLNSTDIRPLDRT